MSKMIPPPGRSRASTGLRIGSSVAALGIAAAVLLQTPPGLDATTPTDPVDTDGDGIRDAQELILGTSPDYPDTDGDGYVDVEELARQSDPLDDLSTPATSSMSVGLYGRADGGVMTSVAAIYLPAGTSALFFELGVVVNGLQIPLAPSTYAASSSWAAAAASAPDDAVMVLRTQFPEMLVMTAAGFAVYARVTNQVGSGPCLSADAMDLVHFSGVTMSVEAAPASLHDGGGIVYRPLSDGDDVPPELTPGQICWRLTQPVGTLGASTLHEVVEAACEDSDAYCSPADCTSGGLIPLTDPGVLLGG